MINIVVIGDSIAKGVGSSDASTKNFGALVGEKVNGKVTNLGISGLESSELLEKLDTEKFQNALENADVIFVSIGSNDLLQPFLSIIAEAAGLPPDERKDFYKKLQKAFSKMSKEDPLKAGDALATAVNKIVKGKQLDEACEQFPKNFDKIITNLRTNYPEAIIYVNNLYNPYYGVSYEYGGVTLLNIHDICEKYILRLNKTFDVKSEDYTMIDMYSIFRQKGYTNVNGASLQDMSGVNFDPHPNDAGYQMMADYIYTKLDSIAPRVELQIENLQKVPANMEGMGLCFSEKVRPIEGKQLILSTEKTTLAYTLTGQEELTETSDGIYEMKLSAEMFRQGGVLEYDEKYELVMDEGAFKDRGNNSPDELFVAQFHTEQKPEIELAVHSVAVVNEAQVKGSEEAHTILLVSQIIFVVIAVAIAIYMLYNKKRMK